MLGRSWRFMSPWMFPDLYPFSSREPERRTRKGVSFQTLNSSRCSGPMSPGKSSALWGKAPCKGNGGNLASAGEMGELLWHTFGNECRGLESQAATAQTVWCNTAVWDLPRSALRTSMSATNPIYS